MSAELAKAKVLVVDDFQSMRTILRDIVRAMGIQQVDTASNGREALAKLHATRYDVVLCDFNLGPGLNGQQVLDEGRLHGSIGLSSIWVMVTAEKTAEMIMGAAESKPDEYLLKPINQSILEGRLERLLEKKQALRGVEEALRAKNYPRALEQCKQLLQSPATRAPEIIRIQGDVLLKMQEWSTAKALYESVLSQRNLPWARTGLGKVHYHLGEYDAARSQFQQVLSENRVFIEAADWLAKTLLAMGENEQAQQVLEDAVRLSPNSADRQQVLGETARNNGALDVAQSAFEKTIKISEHATNKRPGAYIALARVLSESDEPDIALKVMARTQEVFKDAGGAIAIQVAAVQSVLYQQTGKKEEAQAALEQAEQLLARQGGNAPPQATLELAQSMLALGHKEKACTLVGNLVKANHENTQLSAQVQHLFEQANLGEEGKALIAASREEAVAINNQGVMLGRQGQFAVGARLLRIALQNLPHSEVMMMNLCGLLIGQIRAEGRTDALVAEVMGLVERVRDVNPDNAKLRQYVQLIRSGGLQKQE